MRGKVNYELTCAPRFNYSRDNHKTVQISPNEVIFECEGKEGIALKLISSVPLSINNADVVAEFSLAAGETADFLLKHVDKKHDTKIDFETFVTEALFRTINYWKGWVSQCTYNGRWREMVNRSALVLKLLTSF